MAIIVQIAGLEDRDMTEKKDRIHVCRIGPVIADNQIANTRRAIVFGDIMPNDLPAISDEIRLESSKLGGKTAYRFARDNQDHFPAALSQCRINPCVDITVSAVSEC